MNAPKSVGIIDYGMGNLLSVANAVEAVGASMVLCRTPADLDSVTHVILPGVGAFGDCIQNLKAGGWDQALDKKVRQQGAPFLGICLGLQILSAKGFEGGEFAGLGWIPGEVRRLPVGHLNLKVPHVGWESVTFQKSHPLLNGIRNGSDFYFVHSYHLQCDETDWVLGEFSHGTPITAAVLRGNIVATQFHPEKSSEVGLKFLENFCQWDGRHG